MENIGVAVGIIVDTSDEDIDTIVMSDDGTGGGIRIPSMLIGKKEGNILIDYYFIENLKFFIVKALMKIYRRLFIYSGPIRGFWGLRI